MEYAMWLGMDPDKDADLLWIARDGLKVPLPHPWKPCQTGDGELFYFNFETGESVWDHPCDDHNRRVYQRMRAEKYGLPYDDDDPEKRTSLNGSEAEDGMGAAAAANA